jgi:hypothetical protein
MTERNDREQPNVFVLEPSTHESHEKIPSDFTSEIHEDKILALKMRYVNNAIDEIGFTTYQFKLFFLNGFGYAVDSLLILLNALTQPQVVLQYQPYVSKAQTMAVGLGLLFGALFWGLGADVSQFKYTFQMLYVDNLSVIFQVIGRKYAFNITLLWCAISATVAGVSPNYLAVCIFVGLMAFGGGGNLILDTAVYLEFLPGKYQWSLTFMAAWWGVGQMVASLVAWPFMANFSCETASNCTNANNRGWRYTFFTLGGFVLILSLLRMIVIRLKESPKWLLSQNRDAEVVKIIDDIAKAAGKQNPLTLEKLQSIGTVQSANKIKKYNPMIFLYHIKGMFFFFF